MPDFSDRSAEPEIMDDLNCDGEVVFQTLRELEFINKWLGGNAVTISALDALTKKIKDGSPLRIADLGCGSGEMLRIIATWAARKRIAVQLTGIDANPNIIAYAARNLEDLPDVNLHTMNIFSPEFKPGDFDIVIGTLLFHHFTEPELITFFSRIRSSGTKHLIINDIHRHFLAYHSIRTLTRLFSASSMVKYDAPLSVLRAFSRVELEEILRKSGFSAYRIHWKWAFRWQVVTGIW